MALLAESLVDEWLNRHRFFTIRGVKHGQGEMDLLAVQHSSSGVVGWHVEVTVSFNPIGYICKDSTNSFVRKRTAEQIGECACVWVDKKFRDERKIEIREKLWPKIQWSYHLVYGRLKHDNERPALVNEGVTCHSFEEVLDDLSKPCEDKFTASAGGDMADIVNFYKTCAGKS